MELLRFGFRGVSRYFSWASYMSGTGDGYTRDGWYREDRGTRLSPVLSFALD